MRLLAVIAVLVMLPLVAAQPPEFANPHQVRIAHGDIPSTNLVEDAGQWNFQETFVVAEGSSTTWTVPEGHTLVSSGCNNCSHTSDGSEAPTYNLTCVGADGGSCAITVNHATPGDATSFGARMDLRASSIVILYTAQGSYVHAPLDAVVNFQCASRPHCEFYQFNTASLDAFWFNVAPEAPDTTTVAPASGGNGWLFLFVGLALGATIWYSLVRYGYVQKRQRKQVVAEAAHKQVAKSENKETLQGRKRALMAALKELEVAKMNKELNTDAYDALKAEFKKETVTVMRALEEAS